MKKNMHILLRCFFLIAFFCFFLSPGFAFAGNDAQEHRTVRVGFFPFEGYYSVDADGHRSGYGYELMQLMAMHTNWSYEYIDTVKTWQELEAMLLDGRLDMLTSVQKTPEGLNRFAFSDIPISSSSTLFTVRAGNTAFIAGDYTSYEGTRVGMMRSASHNEKFARFASEHGFTYTPVYFDALPELLAALQEGTAIDAAVTSSLRPIHNEWIMEQFMPAPFYLMVRKDDFSLQQEMNTALRQMDTYSPDWRSELFHKYYAPDSGSSLLLSAEERAYISELRQNGVRFRVAVNPDNAPYSYFENGEARGIIPEIFAEIARRASIDYDILPAADRLEYEQLIQSGQADLIMDAGLDYAHAELLGYKLSKSYLTISVAQLTRTNFSGSIRTAAIPEGPHTESIQTMPLFQDRQLIPVRSTANAIAAVTQGQTDSAYLFMYAAQKYIHDNVHSQLQLTLLPKLQFEKSIASAARNDYRLLSILSKSAESVRGSYAQQIVLKYTTLPPPELSLMGYLYANPLSAIAVTAAAGLLLLLGALAVLRSRTARREHARKQELEQFLSYVCRANDLVIEIDPFHAAGRRYILQDGHVTILTQPADIAEYLSLVHPDDRPSMEKYLLPDKLRHILRERKELYIECRIRTQDEHWHWYAHTLQGIAPSKQYPQGAFILFRRDINETKQTLVDALNAARRASETKGNFLSHMSHEIRTPLNAIIGYLTLLQKPGISADRIHHAVSGSRLAAEQLLAIINDVLDIASIESGRMKISQNPFSLQDLLEELSALFREQALEKQLIFSIETQVKETNDLLGDRLRIRQILTNLLSNAIKFTPAGGSVLLQVEELPHEKNQLFIKFRIKDTGIGMSEEFLSRIFTPFEQESAQTTQKFGGTGLGLSISHNLVHMLHGSIEVKSQLQKGSTFIVTLPFERTRQSLQKKEASPFPEHPALKGKLHLLLAEDNAMNREIAAALLGECGISLDTAVNGQEAADIFQKSPAGTYQAILMDLQMPVMNGYESTRAIRRSGHPEAKTIPIIAVTADVFAEDVARALACGMNDYVSKPIDYEKLLASLAKLQKQPATSGASKTMDA